MFRKIQGIKSVGTGSTAGGASSTSDPKVANPIKHEHPKVFLVDIDRDCADKLVASGYNVSTGSFGAPYRVEKADGYTPVILGTSMSGHEEQEIVVIDLAVRRVAEATEGEKLVSTGSRDWWASSSAGFVDPRPRMMADLRTDFDRILRNGGAFVLFAAPRLAQDIILTKKGGYYLESGTPINEDNWSFLTILKASYGREVVSVVADSGTEIRLSTTALSRRILSGYLDGASFSCTLRLAEEISKNWLILATNKYGAPVAGALLAHKGLLLIVPQIDRRALFLQNLLDHVLPEICPHLFPHAEGTRWVQMEEYELPAVLGLKARIEVVQEEARRKTFELEGEIEQHRESLGFLHDLIRATGDDLVVAVRKALETIGFTDVVDMDEEIRAGDGSKQKGEDLQIRSDSPLLLVEVKGIGGLPSDGDALQVSKYVAPRMRELGTTEVQGLSIVNHQRHIPALERQNRSPFREDILTNAIEQGFGLMTTWDLYRLVRSYLANGWEHPNVKPLFYQVGRISPVPSHYQLVGTVEHFWEGPGAVGIRLENGDVSVGDRVAFELQSEFVEQPLESLQIEGQTTNSAQSGTVVGATTSFTKNQLKKGVPVFRVIEPLVTDPK